MRIMLGIVHPKQVHFWKNIIYNLTKRGHEVKIVAWDKDITLYLLNAYGLKYELIGANYKGLIKKAYGMFISDAKVLNLASKFKPDILLGGAPYLAHVSKLIRKPHITVIDTEHANLANNLSFPFTNVVITPSCYKGKIDLKKHIKYNGYMELAYLHPNYFKPDLSIIEDLGLKQGDTYIIMRLVSWNASHDNDSKGFSYTFLKKAIKSFEEYGHVFITSEQKLGKDLEKYKITFPPEKLHSALYCASLCFGEGGTTAVESALLGTPSVHMEAFRSNDKLLDATMIHGNFDELVNMYGLLNTFSNQDLALREALKILQDMNIKKQLSTKKKLLIHEKIDVTGFFTDFIEDYPRTN